MAAAAVVFIHVWALAGFQGLGVNIDYVVGNYFRMAVPLFYALSAFSLLYGYEKVLNDEFLLKKFYLRRFFRLAPLFYVLIIVNMILYHVKFDLAKILLNVSFTYSFVPTQQESIVPAGWSIGVEWIFYLMFPLVILVSRSMKMLLFFILIFLIISVNYEDFTRTVVAVSPTLKNLNIIKHFGFFLIGALVYKLMPFINEMKHKWKRINRIEILFLCSSLSIFFIFDRIVKYEILISVFFIMLLSWAIVGFSRLFNNRLTRTMGKCSYGIYLLHPLVIYFLRDASYYEYIRGLFDGFPHPVLFSFLTASLSTVFMTTIVSLFAYYYIEQPGIKLGNRLIKGSEQRNITQESPISKAL